MIEYAVRFFDGTVVPVHADCTGIALEQAREASGRPDALAQAIWERHGYNDGCDCPDCTEWTDR